MPAAADEDEPAAAAAVTSAAGNVASGTEGGCEPCVRSVTLQGVAAHGGEGTGGGPVPGKGMRAGETGERGEGAAGGTTVPQACDAAVSVGGDASGGRGIGPSAAQQHHSRWGPLAGRQTPLLRGRGTEGERHRGHRASTGE